MQIKQMLGLLAATLLVTTAAKASEHEHYQLDAEKHSVWYANNEDELAAKHREEVAKREAYWDAHKTVSDQAETTLQSPETRQSSDY